MIEVRVTSRAALMHSKPHNPDRAVGKYRDGNRNRADRSPVRSPAGEVFTDLIFELFRMHGQLLAAGERLTVGHAITVARWQVLGAVQDQELTVPQIARNMGLQRQTVQRTVDLLTEEGFVELTTNPHHRRAKLVTITTAGQNVLAQVRVRQTVWANRIAANLPLQSIRTALSLVRQLRVALEEDR